MTLTKPQIEMLKRMANGDSWKIGQGAGKLNIIGALMDRQLVGRRGFSNEFYINDAGRAALAEAEGKE